MSPAHTAASCSPNSPQCGRPRGSADFAKPEVGNAAGRPGAGRRPKPVFCDRLLLAPVHLRHQLPHDVLAEPYGVDRSTVSTAIRQVRPLLAARSFAVPHRPGVRLHARRTTLGVGRAVLLWARERGSERDSVEFKSA
ncbi:transposase family protein [Streptomyces sp. NPDC002809]|uniref:helix-turn-helix domain-containing protein n=1 Tax=Streptomyces sp. NPDC002809 TaxID=3154433 RepID=UPI003333156C